MEPSISSESAAEVNSLVAAVEEGAKEEFFDAHESYHVIPGCNFYLIIVSQICTHYSKTLNVLSLYI